MTLPETCGYSDHFHDIEHVYACSMCGGTADRPGRPDESVLPAPLPPVEGAVSQRYEVAKRVVETKTFANLEGVVLDLFTASALVTVFEALSAANQAQFDSIQLHNLAAFCLSRCHTSAT